MIRRAMSEQEITFNFLSRITNLNQVDLNVLLLTKYSIYSIS